ncbi:unnamed protein product, partial [Amoebophrya sp. A25]
EGTSSAAEAGSGTDTTSTTSRIAPAAALNIADLLDMDVAAFEGKLKEEAAERKEWKLGRSTFAEEKTPDEMRWPLNVAESNECMKILRNKNPDNMQLTNVAEAVSAGSIEMGILRAEDLSEPYDQLATWVSNSLYRRAKSSNSKAMEFFDKSKHIFETTAPKLCEAATVVVKLGEIGGSAVELQESDDEGGPMGLGNPSNFEFEETQVAPPADDPSEPEGPPQQPAVDVAEVLSRRLTFRELEDMRRVLASAEIALFDYHTQKLR